MAEVGGGRKRNATLELDWDKLLPREDDEHPPLKVIPEVEIKWRQSPAIGEEEETSTRDLQLRQMPNKELRDSITRLNKFSSASAHRLPDGGEKVRALLMSYEAEFKRRKLQKDDEKCKKATPSVDELSRIDAKVGISPGTSSSAPASKSTFAKHFAWKLDDKIGLGVIESYEEEISTLKDSDNKNPSPNGQFRFRNTHNEIRAMRSEAAEQEKRLASLGSTVAKDAEEARRLQEIVELAINSHVEAVNRANNEVATLQSQLVATKKELAEEQEKHAKFVRRETLRVQSLCKEEAWTQRKDTFLQSETFASIVSEMASACFRHGFESAVAQVRAQGFPLEGSSTHFPDQD